MEAENCSIRFIPEDITFRILLRLTAKSLLRFRFVCKAWCNIIDSVSFANRHFLTRAAAADDPQILALPLGNKPFEALPALLYDDSASKDSGYPILELSSLPQNSIRYVAYGLLCFRNHRGETFLCNPLRGEALELPRKVAFKMHFKWDRMGMGVDCTTNTYKIVHVFGFAYSMKTEVYSLGTSSWRQISSVPSSRLSEEGVTACGDVHWLNYNRFSSTNADELKIISFDFKKEEFKETPHPDFGERRSSEVMCTLVNLRESLATVKFSYSYSPYATADIEIWVLKDYDKNEWAKVYRISKPDIKQATIFTEYYSGPGDGLYFIANQPIKLYLLDLKSNCICQMERSGGVILGYRASVLSLKNFGNILKVATFLKL